jgi:L-rhamnose mutarotase
MSEGGQPVGATKRHGQVIRLREDGAELYIALHAQPWDEVVEDLKRAGYLNYTIFRHGNLLFSYYELQEGRVVQPPLDPVVARWLETVMPLQEPLPDRQPGEWWAEMEEVFHLD